MSDLAKLETEILGAIAAASDEAALEAVRVGAPRHLWRIISGAMYCGEPQYVCMPPCSGIALATP